MGFIKTESFVSDHLVLEHSFISQWPLDLVLFYVGGRHAILFSLPVQVTLLIASIGFCFCCKWQNLVANEWYDSRTYQDMAIATISHFILGYHMIETNTSSKHPLLYVCVRKISTALHLSYRTSFSFKYASTIYSDTQWIRFHCTFISFYEISICKINTPHINCCIIHSYSYMASSAHMSYSTFPSYIPEITHYSHLYCNIHTIIFHHRQSYENVSVSLKT